MGRVFFTIVVLVLLLVVGVAGLGYYREWFHVGTTTNPQTGHKGVEVTVDQDKMKGDIEKARKQVTPANPQTEEK
jgi:hypothetical protein